jgi:superfamily I DNA/RNA helicase
MTNRYSFQMPEITDEDIRRISPLLGLREDAFHGQDGCDGRLEVFKSGDTIDVVACPGSGKTTLLVAKLAVLATKWPYRSRGMCVLSHTNAARQVIESRLGNNAAGRSLLSYPHFVGTIHSFIDEHLAIPWLRSKGNLVRIIDDDICETRRWNSIYPVVWRTPLENRNTIEGRRIALTSREFAWSTRDGYRIGTDKPSYQAIRAACIKTFDEGYHCYDDMLMWADELMDKFPSAIPSVRARFPFLFIDECQDTSETLSRILHRVFIRGENPVIRQRFGDGNQAIFDFESDTEASTDRFPGESEKKDLPNSHRFGQSIAKLADPLGLVPPRLQGLGPRNLLASGMPEAKHTIFLFKDDGMQRVLDNYAQLLTSTFDRQELSRGTFCALGQVHNRRRDDHKPRHLGHYWTGYDPALSKSNPKPLTLVQYALVGLSESQQSGEFYPATERIAEGLLRLAGMAEGAAIPWRSRYRHRHVMQLLDAYPEVRDDYLSLLQSLIVKRESLTQAAWNDKWREIARRAAEAVAGAKLEDRSAPFLQWAEGPVDTEPCVPRAKDRDNIYRVTIEEKEVGIRVGSIHSAKGQTHTATLVLETFWADNYGRHNLELLMPWLKGDKTGGDKCKEQQKYRLKLHYVAMTRPTHLLCLAMKRSCFEKEGGELDTNLLDILKTRGWQILEVT